MLVWRRAQSRWLVICRRSWRLCTWRWLDCGWRDWSEGVEVFPTAGKRVSLEVLAFCLSMKYALPLYHQLPLALLAASVQLDGVLPQELCGRVSLLRNASAFQLVND